MSIENINISDSEMEIMVVLWNSKEPITSAEIGKAVEKRGWKKTTIATFLTRLVEKGVVSTEKKGKIYYYTPIIPVEEYRKEKTKSIISNFYHGSVKEFAVSLFENEKLSKEDLEELRAIFDN
ncbi:MAG: BlaI/MecI/CopY family transcriptional regulator [Ruminococcaceae bacterium]|nr:BlaI/MecI/CopY family transcriptional regulator [Oscillospiraceae bacterium]